MDPKMAQQLACGERNHLLRETSAISPMRRVQRSIQPGIAGPVTAVGIVEGQREREERGVAMNLLVLGGTGLAGRAVTAEAVTRGHLVSTFSRHGLPPASGMRIRSFAGDLLTGHGLAGACGGVDAVIDCANIETLRGSAAALFFRRVIERAVAAAAQAGVEVYVLLSVVGADRFPLGYYRAKAAQESRLAEIAGPAGVRPVVARTAQFYDFAAQSLRRGGFGAAAFVPALRIQPVDLRAVARHVVSLAEQPVASRAPDLAGPRMESLPDLVRRYAAARRLRRWVVPVPLLGDSSRANRAGALLPVGGLRDEKSFDDWLLDLPGARARASGAPP